jgi:hypothetical protein
VPVAVETCPTRCGVVDDLLSLCAGVTDIGPEEGLDVVICWSGECKRQYVTLASEQVASRTRRLYKL